MDLSMNPDPSLNFAIVGPRTSGKSNYGGALATWNKSVYFTNQPAYPFHPVQSVTPGDDNAHSLQKNFTNQVLTGNKLERTELPTEENAIIALPSYSLKVQFKDEWTHVHSLKSLTITFRDYAGELVSGPVQANPDRTSEIQAAMPTFMQQLVGIDGIIFFVDGNAHWSDQTYSQNLDTFLEQLTNHDPIKQYRLALVIGKCDYHELRLKRYRGKEVVEKRFTAVQAILKKWKNSVTVEYFCCSAFGTVGVQPPKANAQLPPGGLGKNREGIQATIKNADLWRPFGLFGPLYWLATGNMPAQIQGEFEPW
jgi:hypothetical protein